MTCHMDRYFTLLQQLWPLHRTLVCDDMDRAVGLIERFLREELRVPSANIRIHEFDSDTELSTWIVPQKYTLRDYRLVQHGVSDRVIVDRSHISLSVAEYSRPVSGTFGWDELAPHLFYSARRPHAVPFVFKYFYRPSYGFCIPKDAYDTLDHEARFTAEIDSELSPGTLKCLEVVLPGAVDDSLLVMSNICHPHQVNDSVTGAINALMLVEHFMQHPARHTLRFGFWPETIGAMAYFTRYFDERRLFRFAVFTEMLGTEGPYALQWSRQEGTLIDRAAAYVLQQRGVPFRSGRYTTVLRNDERISNGINIDIPSVSLSRYPYAEYHTSDDSPAIVDMRRLGEASDITREILTIVDEDAWLLPAPSVYGQPFLTRFGLFHDPPGAGGAQTKNLNKIMEDVFSHSDGTASLFDIADRFGYAWDDVSAMAEGLVAKGLFSARRRTT